MGLGTKFGIGVAVVAVAAGASYYASRGMMGSSHENKPVAQAPSEPAAPPTTPVTAVTPAPEPSKSEPPAPPAADSTTPVVNTGIAASPPAVTVEPAMERSFRAKPETPAEPTVAAAPAPVTEASPTVVTVPITPTDPAPPPVTPVVEAKETFIPPVTENAAAPAAPVVVSASTTPPATTQPTTVKPLQHIIQAGDTYSSLAEKYLGNGKYSHLIAKANPGKDPRRLFVGARINIPPKPADAPGKVSAASTKAVRVPSEPAAPVPTERAYKVKSGESWNDIAKRVYGDGKRWTELYEFNKDRVPTNPGALKAGMVIELPPDAKLSTSRPS